MWESKWLIMYESIWSTFTLIFIRSHNYSVPRLTFNHVHLFTSVTTHYLGQLYEFFIKDWHFDAYLLDFLIFFLDMHKNCYLYNWFDIYMQGTILWKQSPYQTLNISWNIPNALAAFKIQTLSFQRRPQINMKKISLLQIRYPFF